MNRLGSVAVLALGLLACVPASEPLPPAGAAGFLTEPSAAARGEPFTTADGWTVTISKLALRVFVRATSVETGAFGSGGTEAWLFDGSRSALIYVRELEPGQWWAYVDLSTGYLGGSGDEARNIGVPSSDASRFGRAADIVFGTNRAGSNLYSAGPSVILGVHAEKAGRAIDFDLAVATMIAPNYEPRQANREVRANDVDAGPATVKPEAVFMSESSDDLRFEPFASADTDGDGHLTAAELNAAPTAESPKLVSRTESLGDRLATRSSTIVALP